LLLHAGASGANAVAAAGLLSALLPALLALLLRL
jgi:hypothetical protein